jgi:hypothetical protein
MLTTWGNIGAGPPVSIRSRGRCVRRGTTRELPRTSATGGATISNTSEGMDGGDNEMKGTCCLAPLAKPALRLSGFEGTGGWPARIRAASISGVMLILRDDHRECPLSDTRL